MVTNPHRRSLLIAAAATSALEATGCATWRDPVSVENYIVERSKEWTNSYVTGNPEVMERILAHDFVNTNPRGDEQFTSPDRETAIGLRADMGLRSHRNCRVVWTKVQ